MSKATINHAGGVTVEPGGIKWETVGGKLTCLSVPRGRFGVDLQYEGVIKLGQDGEMVAYHYAAVHPDFVQAPDPMCVTLTVSCIDWVSRVDRAGMSRLYTVYFERDENPVHWDTVRNLAVFWLRASPSPCEFTWSELHRLLRLMETYVQGHSQRDDLSSSLRMEVIVNGFVAKIMRFVPIMTFRVEVLGNEGIFDAVIIVSRSTGRGGDHSIALHITIGGARLCKVSFRSYLNPVRTVGPNRRRLADRR